MKKTIYILLLVVLGPTYLSAQQIIKLNLPNLINRNISLVYEKAANPKISLGLGVAVTPSRNIPGSGIVKAIFLRDPDNNGFEFNGTYTKVALTPFIRLYPIPSQEAPSGFFVSLALRYSQHNITVPYSITIDNTPITTEAQARLHIIGPALSLGYQALLTDQIVIDIFLGGGLATAPFRIKIFDENLSETAYAEILDRILSEVNINVDPEDIPNFLTNRGLNVRAAIPLFPLVRTGFAIGYKF